MPNVVSRARSLLLISATSAMRAFSPILPINLFIAQRLHRTQGRGTAGRVQAEEDSDSGADASRQQDCRDGDRQRKTLDDAPADERDQRPDQDADQPATDR